MATDANVKDATTFPARADNLFFAGGKTVGNGAFTRLKNAIKASYAYNASDPGAAWPVGRPDANDVASWLYKQSRGLVNQQEVKIAEAAISQPAEFEA